MNSLYRQRGAALVIGLIVLLALTLIGTSGINSVRIDERMVANSQDAAMALSGAEAGMVQCETDILASDLVALNAVAVPVNAFATLADDGSVNRWWDDPDFWSDRTTRLSDFDSFSNLDRVDLSGEPACVIEFIGDANPSLEFGQAVANETAASRKVYRVTGFSYGATERTYAVVESIYAK